MEILKRPTRIDLEDIAKARVRRVVPGDPVLEFCFGPYLEGGCPEPCNCHPEVPGLIYEIGRLRALILAAERDGPAVLADELAALHAECV
jgi:hypothetical protein